MHQSPAASVSDLYFLLLQSLPLRGAGSPSQKVYPFMTCLSATPKELIVAISAYITDNDKISLIKCDGLLHMQFHAICA